MVNKFHLCYLLSTFLPHYSDAFVGTTSSSFHNNILLLGIGNQYRRANVKIRRHDGAHSSIHKEMPFSFHHHRQRQRSSVVNLQLGDTTTNTQMDSISSNNSSGTDDTSSTNVIDWIALGMSFMYLCQFSSLYTQLPGLFGSSGVQPISNTDAATLLLLPFLFPNRPDFGIEALTTLGMILSGFQIIIGSSLRKGWRGFLSNGLLWMCWHDIVISGERFLQYQMDLLFLDAGAILALSTAAIPPTAAIFAFRWLLSRLYVGAGAVKLLSCDSSWRDLSAVHWHVQSQPLPNPIGGYSYVHFPTEIWTVLTAITLVVEMAAPFLFLAPSREIRRVAFIAHVLLMVGIALFGNFGTFQALLIVIGLALLDDLPPLSDSSGTSMADAASSSATSSSSSESRAINWLPSNDAENVAVQPADLQEENRVMMNTPNWNVLLSGTSLALAAAAALWSGRILNLYWCSKTLSVDPIVYSLAILGATVATLPALTVSTSTSPKNKSSAWISTAASWVFLAGSAPIMANGLGVALPGEDLFAMFNIAATPYHLFATVTGADGSRSVAAIEAATSMDGPWYSIPFLYQINDPGALLPLCFPHFPRLDWTIWFIPLGETGVWIARLFQGITVGDPDILRLLDQTKFRQQFPDHPPSIIRVIARKYQLDDDYNDGNAIKSQWIVRDDPRYSQPIATYHRKEKQPNAVAANPWPRQPLRTVVEATVRPEFFVWGCIGTVELLRRAATTTSVNNIKGNNIDES
jgi:hypothetical protein